MTPTAEPLPDAVDEDIHLSPEEAERARKKYLLKRFWISARGYWSRRGDRLAWPCSIGLLALIGMNVGFSMASTSGTGKFSTPSNSAMHRQSIISG